MSHILPSAPIVYLENGGSQPRLPGEGRIFCSGNCATAAGASVRARVFPTEDGDTVAVFAVWRLRCDHCNRSLREAAVGQLRRHFSSHP